MDVVGVDGRKRPGSGLADQPDVIGERELASPTLSRSPKLDVGFTPLREQDLARARLGEAA